MVKKLVGTKKNGYLVDSDHQELVIYQLNSILDKLQKREKEI